MTQDPTLGQVLELASSDDPEDDQYQVVLFQRGDPSTYPDFIAKSEEDLRASYGFIRPSDITIQVEGAQVEAVRCDIQAYYAVLATITYDSGDVGLRLCPHPAGLHQRRAQPGRKRDPGMSEQKAMQRLAGLMRKAVQDYEMLAPGDRVLVGVSGGKDSVALTVGLALLREYIGFDYQLYAVTLDPQFGRQPGDYSQLASLMERCGIPYQVRRTDIGPVVFEERQEKNPCALCAKLRRGRAAHGGPAAGVQQGGPGPSPG